MISQYNKATEYWTKNGANNVSTYLSLISHSAMVKKGTDNLSTLLSKKQSMDLDKPFPMENITPLRFVGKPINNEREGNI